VVEVDHACQIAEERLRLQERGELKLSSNDRLPRAFETLTDRFGARFEGFTFFGDAKKDADFFEQLSRRRHPMAKRLVGIVMVRKNPSRLFD
jgi:hypothetical protein